MVRGATAMQQEPETQEPISPVLDGANLIAAALAEPLVPVFDGHSRGLLARLTAEEAGIRAILENIAGRQTRASDDYQAALAQALDARDRLLGECRAEQEDAMRALSAIGIARDRIVADLAK